MITIKSKAEFDVMRRAGRLVAETLDKLQHAVKPGMTTADLDRIAGNRPVIVMHFSFHEAVVSSAGLRAAGIDRRTPDPFGGRIVRDRSAADDVLVDAFWRAYRGRAQFDLERSFGGWMRRIATNAALDHLRMVSRRRESQQADDTLAAPEEADRETRDAIAAAFRRLPPELQVVAALALVEEQPYADIADALGIPVGTVKSRVFRATRLLREELARAGVRPC